MQAAAQGRGGSMQMVMTPQGMVPMFIPAHAHQSSPAASLDTNAPRKQFEIVVRSQFLGLLLGEGTKDSTGKGGGFYVQLVAPNASQDIKSR